MLDLDLYKLHTFCLRGKVSVFIVFCGIHVFNFAEIVDI